MSQLTRVLWSQLDHVFGTQIQEVMAMKIGASIRVLHSFIRKISNKYGPTTGGEPLIPVYACGNLWTVWCTMSCPCLNIEPPASGVMGYLARLASKSKPDTFERKLSTGWSCSRNRFNFLDPRIRGSSLKSAYFRIWSRCFKAYACSQAQIALPHPRRKQFSKR